MKRTITALALVAAILALAPRQADAQSSTITATATVLTALNVTGVDDLDFGLVPPGFTKDVLVTDAGVGTFDITGSANAEVTLTFTQLPVNLQDALLNNLPITYAGVYNTIDDAGTGAALNTGGATTANLDAATGELYIFLGGTVDAGASPPNGTYNGTVELTVAYTGN
jgi:spore coat protein U-like protein